MLKDFMLEVPAAFVPAEEPAHTPGISDEDAPARQPPASKVLRSKPCVLPLSGSGTDVSQVLHVVRPREVHAAVVTDLRATGGIIPLEVGNEASEQTSGPKGSM